MKTKTTQPLQPGIHNEIFANDYNSGRFVEVGLSSIIYENNQKNMNMLLDIFSLANQMLAEQSHPDGETTPAKHEGWLVRRSDPKMN
ncbi:hypothetical protein [Rubritalea sp.]|uniref:hypothetical protein n=1 Tax=Rubritalea sp. TaxID=2109375 RepID=UPI003EF5FBCA